MLHADDEEASRLPKISKEPPQHLTQLLFYASQERRNHDVAKAVELTTASSELHPSVMSSVPRRGMPSRNLFGLPTEGSCVVNWA
jgi:hypothetical protein